ncbi:MAG: hypothetical protein J1E34_02815 [Oscillospiraceae bacterium]|nr:hypothetical protein [Oscillospiraceae bacterium]
MSKKSSKKTKKPSLKQKITAFIEKKRPRQFALNAGKTALEKADTFIRYKYSALFLAVIMLGLMLFTYSITSYNYLFNNFPMYATRTVQFYLIDYSVGFVSRALIGHIISLFTDKVSFVFFLALTKAVLWISLILQALLAAAAFKKAWLKKSPLLCVLFVFFALSHHTVMPNVMNYGILDTYNLLLAVFYIYISDKKGAFILTPVICFTGIILHYQFVLAYLTMIFSVELYYIVKNKKGRALRAAFFCFTAAGSIALTVYLMFFSKYGVKMSASELYEYMLSKYPDARATGLFEEYFTYYIYGDYQGVNYSAPADFIKFLVSYAAERIRLKKVLLYSLSTFPVFGIILYFWIYILKRTDKKSRLPYLVFMLQPLMLIISVIASTDTSRWAGASFFSNFMLLFAVLKSDEPLLCDAAKKCVSSAPKKIAVLLILFLSFASTAYIYYVH